jgi:hypothetical protein
MKAFASGDEQDARVDRCFEGSQTGYASPLVSSSHDSYRATTAKTLPGRKSDFARGENSRAASCAARGRGGESPEPSDGEGVASPKQR